MPYWAAQAKGTDRGGGGCTTRASKGCSESYCGPSFFLEDINWEEQVHVHCVGGSFVEMELVDDDAMKTRADLLAKLIRQRLANHKSEKVDANKQSHFTLG
jgi:hypothetical protein